MYTARFTADAIGDIKKIPKNVQRPIRKQLEEMVLKNSIAFSEELTGPPAQFRSFHYLNYRIVYLVSPL